MVSSRAMNAGRSSILASLAIPVLLAMGCDIRPAQQPGSQGASAAASSVPGAGCKVTLAVEGMT